MTHENKQEIVNILVERVKAVDRITPNGNSEALIAIAEAVKVLLLLASENKETT
jgi:hypothetical protein